MKLSYLQSKIYEAESKLHGAQRGHVGWTSCRRWLLATWVEEEVVKDTEGGRRPHHTPHLTATHVYPRRVDLFIDSSPEYECVVA